MSIALIAALALMLFLSSGCAQSEKAADAKNLQSGGRTLSDFNKLIDEQGVFYRQALLASNNPNKTAEAITNTDKLYGAWSKIREFKTNPPAEYANDPKFAERIDAAFASVEKAQKDLSAGRLSSAHYDLEPIRTIVFELRAQTNSTDHRDLITSFHASMEGVVGLTEMSSFGTSDIKSVEDGMASLKLQFAALKSVDPSVIGLSKEKQSAWKAHIEAIDSGLKEMESAIASENPDAVKAAGQKIKAGYRKIFEMAG